MEVKRIDIDKIIEEIKQAGYIAGQLIEYSQIQELCKQYGKGLKEVDFAQTILGIKYSNYNICKNKGTRVRILKSEEKVLTEEEIKEIIKEIKQAGYIAGQLIEYNQVQELCKKYGKGLKEIDFAQTILGITNCNYNKCKNKGTRVRILKREEKVLTEEEKKK